MIDTMQPSPLSTLIVYCLLVLAASLAGGWIPTVWRWSHRTLQGTMSFVGGVMLGIALLHLLPHSVAETGSTDQASLAALWGLLSVFLLIRVFGVHQHPSYPEECEHHHSEGEHWHDQLDAPLLLPAAPGSDPRSAAPPSVDAGQDSRSHRLSWIGLFAGMSLHTMLDGIAVAASVIHLPASHRFGIAGLGTFLAVLLHKPLDALSITSLMAAGGWSPTWQRRVNVLFSLLCPIAALAFFFGAPLSPASVPLVGWALGFSAGVFLCISLADILPEIQFHAHDRFLLTALLLAGIALAWLVGFLEPAHLHQH